MNTISLKNLTELNKLIPLPLILREMFKHGVKSVSLKEWKLYWGAFEIETGQITINPNANWPEVAKILSGKWGIAISPEEAPVAVFFHEIGHHREREKLLKVKEYGGERGPCEERADAYAKTRFLEWKKSRS